MLKPSRKDWAKWFSSFQPYAATSIQFNEKLDGRRGSDAAIDKTMERVKQSVFECARELDRFYFKTPGITERIARKDRFDAICVAEKLDVNPHVHIAWYLPHEYARTIYGNAPTSTGKTPVQLFFDELNETCLEPIEKKNRLAVLLQGFNRSHHEMNQDDCVFLEDFQADPFACNHPERIPENSIVNWKRRGWTAHTTSTSGTGWDWYISKELTASASSDQVFFLSDAFGDRQRTAPTRYHTIDPETNAKHLDLDAPLKARK